MTAAAFPQLPDTSLREMAAVGFRIRWRVLAALFGPPSLAVLALLVLPPKYRAQSDLLVKNGREYLAQTDGEPGMTAPASTRQEGINSEIALLTGRAVVEATIRAVGLSKLYPGLVEDPPWFESPMDAAVTKFSRALAAEPVKLSNVIAVSFDGSSPAQATAVLDRLMAVYIDKHTQVFAAGRSERLGEAIARGAAESAELERHRTEVKLAAGIYDIGAQRTALISQRVAAEAHLQDVVNSRAMLGGRLAYFAAELSRTPATVRSTGTDRNEAADHQRQGLIDLRAAESAMAARYAPGNPDLQRVRGQIAAMSRGVAGDRVNVSTAPNPLAQQMRSEMAMAQAQLAPLAAEQARYEALVERLSAELQRLERADLDLRLTGARIDALNDNLKLVQARFDQARTQEQMDQARQVSVVQVAPAIAADNPASPKKAIILAAGVLLGLLAAGATVLVAVFTATVTVTEEGLERLLGVPVLLALPAVRRGPVTLPVE